MRGRTLAKATCLYILGLLVAWFIPLFPFIPLFIALVSLALSLWFYQTKRNANFFLMIIFLALGAFRMGCEVIDSGELSFLAGWENSIKISGTVASEVRETETGLSVYFSVDSVQINSQKLKVKEKTIVYLGQQPLSKLRPGQRLTLEGVVQKPKERDNFGGFSYKNYLKAKGVHTVVYLQNQPVVVNPSIKPGLQTLLNLIRLKTSNVIRTSLPKEEGGILNCLLLGDKTGLDEQIRDQFSRSGLSHVLAVSGLHVGVLAAFLYKLKGRFKTDSFLPNLIIVTIIIFYTLLVNTVSAYRAGIMFSLLILARTTHRTYDLITALFGAALIILLIWPGAILDLGFQLSFGATLGLATVHPVLSRRFDTGGSLLKESFAVSIATLIGTVPVLIYYFNQVPLISLLANLVAVPLVGITVVLGWLTTLASLILPFLRVYVYLPLIPFLVGLRSIARLFSLRPFFLQLPRFPLVLISLYYLFLINLDWISLILKTFRKRKRVFISVLIIAFITLGIGRNNYNNKHLTATFLSVGGADCCYVSLPGNKNLLVDVGCEARFTGEGVKQDPEAMLAFLRQRGIKTIDYLVLSHPHLDHYGGLEELLSGFKVKAIFISSDRDWDGVLGTVPENRFYVLQKGAAIHFGPDLRGDILHPPDKLLLNTGSDTNNNSLVFRLQYKGFSLLFAGDIEASAEQVLPVESLKSTVLKVAHHGSPTSTTSDFLQKVQPQYAIISKGSRGNSSEVEARLVASGAVVLSTEKNGAIRITTDGRTVRLATVKKWVTH